MDKLFIVMPAYNEEANIESVISSWYNILEGKNPESKIIVADSGSSDSTHDILLGMKSRYPKLEIYEECERYHGPKLIALYKYAIQNGADWIFQTDSDGQTNPDEFIQFWELRDKYDAILGERRVRGDGKDRAFVERVVCFLLRLFFGVKVPDANAPFRLMKDDMVSKYISRLPEDYNIPNIMMTTYFVYYKEKIEFVPISFKSRQAGTNSMDIGKIVKVGWNALGDFVRFKREM